MRSLESFAALLAASGTQAGLMTLATELGFAADVLPLDADTQVTLGLTESFVRSARIATGVGALRALLVECDSSTPLRTLATTVAQHCSAHAPQLAWLLIATQYNGCDLAIATWSADRSKPRAFALHVDRTHVVPSDAETFAALAAAANEPDILAHAAWLDTLGRDALTRRFYRTLEQVVANLADSAEFSRPRRVSTTERADLALLYVSRLLFLSFLQTKGWLDHDRRFLENSFARCMERGGQYHRKVLLPLFFGTLNTPPRARAAAARAFGRIPFLNGGLFARTHLERHHPDLKFPDDTLGVVFGELLARYRFSPREESANWSEAAVDPEMLGKAFESLMEANARRASGAFYTPRRLVATVSHAALAQALASDTIRPDAARDALDGQMPNDGDAAALRDRCASITILDPACGSGAFLVHILEQLATLRAKLGDPRPVWQIRRDMLTKSIFGVDINPTAVWLCELRLWLSVVIDCDVRDPMLVPPLPNLDRHIRIGDSLAGDPFDPAVRAWTPGSPRLAQLRERYARSCGPRKHTLQRALDRVERTLVIAHLERQLTACAARRRDILSTLRARDLFGTRAAPASVAKQRLAAERDRSRSLTISLRDVRNGGALPFAWITHFPDVARNGGFTAILGNPPWVRLHRIPAAARAELRRRFLSYRNAPWTRGAVAARATLGFAAQVDLAALFAERAVSLLQPGGTLALLLPTKLWRALAGGGVRATLHERARVVSIEDWSEAPRQFDAAVYPSLLVATRHEQHTAHEPLVERETRDDDTIRATVHRPNRTTQWCTIRSRLGFDDDPASPWVLAPPPVRVAFDHLASAGIPLVHSTLGPPQLGVKCGLNEAFIVRCIDAGSAIATVHDGQRTGRVERQLLRPLLRGDGLCAWRQPPNGTGEWIVWTHDERGAPLRSLPPHAHAWLARWRAALSRRADARSRGPWWALFRTGGASSAYARVVWADVGRAPRALVLAPNDASVALNSCYVLACRDPRDAHTLAALLNSPLLGAWLTLIAEPARGGYRRFLAWTIALLPTPRDWSRARDILAPLAQRAQQGLDPDARELLDATLHAYGVRRPDIEPLLEWTAS